MSQLETRFEEQFAAAECHLAETEAEEGVDGRERKRDRKNDRNRERQIF